MLVPDFFTGWAATTAADAVVLLGQLNPSAALTRIGEFVHSARTNGAPRAGLTGFSVSGWLALLLTQSGSLDAGVAYDAVLNDIEPGVLPCPVQLHFAAVNGPDPERFVARLLADGTTLERFDDFTAAPSYASTSISALTTQSAALAFARTTQFLERYRLD